MMSDATDKPLAPRGSRLDISARRKYFDAAERRMLISEEAQRFADRSVWTFVTIPWTEARLPACSNPSFGSFTTYFHTSNPLQEIFNTVKQPSKTKFHDDPSISRRLEYHRDEAHNRLPYPKRRIEQIWFDKRGFLENPSGRGRFPLGQNKG
ncbi:hypothetical protein KM043_010069 [Ampulex compressa]|nr:hypothetical protein KM043_010069 [Ampulex compressa]